MIINNTERLGFGFMRLPTKDNKINYDELNPMVDHYITHGGKYFDTGYQYHNGKVKKQYKKQ